MAGLPGRTGTNGGRKGHKEELKHLEVLKFCEGILLNSLKSTKTEPCPNCEGTKKVIIGRAGKKLITKKCFTCKGSGKVPKIPAAWKRDVALTLYSKSIPKDINLKEVPDDYESLPDAQIIEIASTRGIVIPADTKRYLKHRRRKK